MGIRRESKIKAKPDTYLDVPGSETNYRWKN